MTKMFRACAMALAALVFGFSAARAADVDVQELIDKSRYSFERMVKDERFPEMRDYVEKAKALLIFPTLVKGGFVIGGEGGSGLLVVRDEKLGWSHPAFYYLAAGSIGLQIGVQVSEAVFTIMSAKALDAVLDNQAKFGGDVSIAVGPIGRGAGADITTNFGADVYSFASTEGLFGGVSFEGAGILKRDEYNEDYYDKGATPYGIVIERKYVNQNAQALRNALAPY